MIRNYKPEIEIIPLREITDMVSLAVFKRNDAVGTPISVNCTITNVYQFGQGLGFWTHNNLKPKGLETRNRKLEPSLPKRDPTNFTAFPLMSLADFIRNNPVYSPVGTPHQPISVNRSITKAY